MIIIYPWQREELEVGAKYICYWSKNSEKK